MRSALPLLALGLAGCPYIFGPPDLSNVIRDSGAPPTTSPSGTTPAGTTPTGTTTGTNPDAPVLSEVTATPGFDTVAVQFRVEDRNGDLTGATVSVDTGAAVLQYTVPADLESWSQFDVSELAVPKATPCEGYTEAWEVTITDAAGNPSAPVPVAVAVRGSATVPVGGTDLGALAPPSTVCGQIEQVDPRQEDHLFVQPAAAGRYTFDLYWSDPSADLDLYVFDGPTELGLSRGANPAPETVVVDVSADTTYRVEVRYWEGPGTTWQLFVRE